MGLPIFLVTWMTATHRLHFMHFQVLLFIFLAYWLPSQTAAQTLEAKRISGFDVSHFNGSVDWSSRELQSKDFVVLKATEGVDWLDPTFADHWKAAKQSGLIRGAYHFFVAEDDPEQEASWYIQNVNLVAGDLPPIVDVERAKKKDTKALAKKLKRFVKHIEKHYGVKPIIYTGPNFWNTYVNQPFDGHHLWIADYGVEEPLLPKSWKKWTFWQFTQKASLDGVEKPVDLNAFSGSRAQLQALLISVSDS